MMAAAGAIIASAAAGALAPDAGAKKRKKAPVIQSVAPKNVSIGETLTIRGKNFVRGRYKNTVVFKRDNSKAVFVKAEIGTRKLLRVTVSDRLTDQLLVMDGAPIATPFRLRVLAKKLSKKFTTGALVPLVGPEKPPAPEVPAEGLPDGDCDLDKVLNRDDADDDNDLLPDATEAAMKTDPCKSDSDEDGVTDGYEFQSAVDLNDDEYRSRRTSFRRPRSGRIRTRSSRTPTSTTTATRSPSARSSRCGRPTAIPRPASTISSTPTATSTRPTGVTAAAAGVRAGSSARTRTRSTSTSSAGPAQRPGDGSAVLTTAPS